MELLLHSIALDWPVLTPIFICSILVVYVAVVKGENGIELVTYEPDEKYIKEVCIKYGHKVKR